MDEIEWDVPLSDELFELPDLEGWSFTDYVMTEVDFSHTALRSGVSFRVRTQDGATLLTEDDVAAVPRGRILTKLKDDQKTGWRSIEVRLTEQAQNRLETVAAAHVGEKLIIDFNGEVQKEIVIHRGLKSIGRIDVSSLADTLEEFEARYLTESDPQANP